MIRERDIIRISTPRDERMAVVREVAAKHDLPAHMLMGPSRVPDVCRARWEAMAELQERFGDRPWRIGRFFARDHSTVLHGLRRHAELQVQ
jgi:chromosomal replication initiation ATPase DnaA